MIVRRGKLIMALCVRADLNPRIFAHPGEVWLDASDCMGEWSDQLANDTGAVMLYVSNSATSEFRARGIYHVLGSTSDKIELACRMAHPQADRISRIVFLSGPHWR
jgi:hypothetical protein